MPILISLDSVHMHGPNIGVPTWRLRDTLSACVLAWPVHIGIGVPAALSLVCAAAFMAFVEIGSKRQWREWVDGGVALCSLG